MHHTFFQEIFEFINKSLCYRYVIRHIFFIIRFVRWEGYTLLYNNHPNRDRSYKRPGNRQGHEEGAEGEAVRGPADTPTGFGKEGQEGKNKYAQEGGKRTGIKKGVPLYSNLLLTLNLIL